MKQEMEIEQTVETKKTKEIEIEEGSATETVKTEKAAQQAAPESKSEEQPCPNQENSTEQPKTAEKTDAQTIKQLQEELAAKEDRLLRQRAEFDNYRKRTQREKEELYQMATADCILPFLGVLDNLERAAEADSEASELKEGVLMILKQFRDLLNQMGIQEIAALGVTFDPNKHNAVNRIEDENYGENVVCQVFQKGYETKDKVLRHAMVVVANP